MIRTTKQTDERREAGPVECWCLHGAVGMAADFRGLATRLNTAKTGTHAVDLPQTSPNGRNAGVASPQS